MVSAYVSIAFALAFLALLGLLHFLKPELDPSWRMISEYEIGRFGWMMRLAFFCWGASVLALLAAIWPSLQSTSGTIGRWWLLVIATALFAAGIFKTNAITDRTPSRLNTLHTISGSIVILTFPIAAAIAVSSLLNGGSWPTYQVPLVLGTALVWIGVVAYFASIIIARVKDPTSGEPGGPVVYQGWPNRFMVVTYLAWIILVAGTSLRV